MKCEIVEHFLSEEECIKLIELAKQRFEKSLTWDVATGTSIENEYRKSEQVWFGRGENPLIADIEQRIASYLHLPIENGENLQLVHYNPGGYYKPHYDYFDPAFEMNMPALNRGGQRAITVLMYLNDCSVGTYFPVHDIQIKSKMGRAIIWLNILEDGSVDPSTFHEGQDCPVGEERYIITKWLRKTTFY